MPSFILFTWLFVFLGGGGVLSNFCWSIMFIPTQNCCLSLVFSPKSTHVIPPQTNVVHLIQKCYGAISQWPQPVSSLTISAVIMFIMYDFMFQISRKRQHWSMSFSWNWVKMWSVQSCEMPSTLPSYTCKNTTASCGPDCKLRTKTMGTFWLHH